MMTMMYEFDNDKNSRPMGPISFLRLWTLWVLRYKLKKKSIGAFLDHVPQLTKYLLDHSYIVLLIEV